MSKIVLAYNDDGQLIGLYGVCQAKDFQQKRNNDVRGMIRDIDEMI